MAARVKIPVAYAVGKALAQYQAQAATVENLQVLELGA
jgi:hypothetical protein